MTWGRPSGPSWYILNTTAIPVDGMSVKIHGCLIPKLRSLKRQETTWFGERHSTINITIPCPALSWYSPEFWRRRTPKDTFARHKLDPSEWEKLLRKSDRAKALNLHQSPVNSDYLGPKLLRSKVVDIAENGIPFPASREPDLCAMKYNIQIT